MSIYFITDIRPDEGPDFLPPVSAEALKIRSLEGEHLMTIAAPAGGWTHEKLEATKIDLDLTDGADAYVGSEWVGSTEI